MFDSLRVMTKEIIVHLPSNKLDELAEHRYQESGEDWRLRTWRDGRETTGGGHMSTRPSWLLPIVNVALLGGHAKHVPEPPPNLIMWFRTNADNSLHSYIDFEK